MSKILKRLYLGDVVKSFGTKQLRKLTTEKQEPTESIIGTWVFNDIINKPETPFYLFTPITSYLEYGYATYTEMIGMDVGSTNFYLTVSVGNSNYNWVCYSFSNNQVNNSWNRTLTFTENVDNENLLTWLKANATKQ